MPEFPSSKADQEKYFEEYRPDEFGSAGQYLELVVSTMALLDTSGSLTIRLQTMVDGSDAKHSFVITPYAAVRLSAALADCVNAMGGDYKVTLDAIDTQSHQGIRITPNDRRR